MPHATPACQLTHANRGDSRGNSPLPDHLAPINVAPADQWITTTTGRITNDPYSWMQAIHWVAGSDLYKPSRTHGPAWGPTTLFIAQEISALSECRPGVDYLARKLKCSERTVQYHLGMLREAGLLAYRSKGTRLSGLPNQASLFERIIPAAFDTALGIRTTGEGVQRRPVGITPESRTAIAKLAKKATRKVRRTLRKRTRSGGSLCTPMQVGTSGPSPTGSTSLPPETSKLASGNDDRSTQKSPKRTPRKMNTVGRRHQLAAEFIALVPWMAGAATPRVAWVLRHVADAGWTALEVQAVAEYEAVTADKVHRPSGMLAHRIKGAHLLYTTPERRATAVAAWQESRVAERARHSGYDRPAPTGGPSSAYVSRLYAEAAAKVTAGPDLAVDGLKLDEIPVGAAINIESFTRDEVLEMRAFAEKDSGVIHLAIDTMGETDARRLYTNRLVDLALKTFSSNTTLNPWMEISRA